MVARAVPDEDRLHFPVERLRELCQKQIHDLRIEPRCDESFGLPRDGTRRRQHVNRTVLCLPDGSRSRPGLRPDTRQRPLLSEPRFVFVEDFESTVGMLRLDLCEPLAELFLKSS